jgi:NADH:ubiquinone reductase (H+-translocating)
MAEGSGLRRVVIVGGGFAGLFAARALSNAPVRVTLLDRAEHHVFQPLLYQCATGILSEGKIAVPLRELLRKRRNVEFLIAEVTDVDPAERLVKARRPLGQSIELRYDYLILAAGVRQSYFGHDEYAEFAPGMKSIEDAMKIRRRVFGAFEMAESSNDQAERARWLTFALVGAGPTGVELAGQIRELATKTLRREYRRIKPEEARVLLFDGGSAPLPMFSPRLSALATRQLKELGVQIHMGSLVTHVDLNGLEVKDRENKVTRYEAGTVLWTAGVAAPPVAAAVARATGAEQDRSGRLVCGPDLSLPGHPEILVAGDIMSLGKLPGVAEVAMQTGLYAGRRIGHLAQGQTYDKPFRYYDLGSAAYISRGHAVVSMFNMHFGGFPGWLVWLFIHIGFLTGYRNRIGAVMGWWYAFTRDLRRERSFTFDDAPTALFGDQAGSATTLYDVPQQAPAPAAGSKSADEPATRPRSG